MDYRPGLHKLVLHCAALSDSMDLKISVTRKIANVLLPVRVAGKSHAGWSRPALHAAPTNPLRGDS